MLKTTLCSSSSCFRISNPNITSSVSSPRPTIQPQIDPSNGYQITITDTTRYAIARSTPQLLDMQYQECSLPEALRMLVASSHQTHAPMPSAFPRWPPTIPPENPFSFPPEFGSPQCPEYGSRALRQLFVAMSRILGSRDRLGDVNRLHRRVNLKLRPTREGIARSSLEVARLDGSHGDSSNDSAGTFVTDKDRAVMMRQEIRRYKALPSGCRQAVKATPHTQLTENFLPKSWNHRGGLRSSIQK
ncbi:hypothetical protein BJ170DRAFT_591401 [Xylariales sp. AK1849]|nr:hypothetical protein BJ170DRAFT_591401 [Xylariales sp. AK1849]